MPATAAAFRDAIVLDGLRAAFEGSPGLDLHYMPSTAIGSGLRTGFEALVRFDHPQLGSIGPAQFVPLAERSELALILGSWVRRRVASDIHLGLLPAGRVAVNVSALELADPTFADRFLDLVEEYGIPVGRLGVEVTETAVSEHFAAAIEALHRLQAAGIPVALDDFGTGHASLEYLARLPCDTVKVDQSFVAGLGVDQRCSAIVAGVIGMAHATGHIVIAEGVETAGQLEELTRMGCDEAQGFLFGKPTIVGEIPAQRPPLHAVPYRAEVAKVPRSHVHQRFDSAQVLVDLLRDIGQAADISEAFRILVAALRPLVDFTGGSVQLAGEDGIRLAAAHPPPTDEARAARIPLGQGIGGSVIATGHMRYLPDIASNEAVSNDRRARSTTRHTRSYLAIPLFVETTCVGLVQLDSVEVDAFDIDVHFIVAACAGPLSTVLARSHPDHPDHPDHPAF